MIKEKKENFVSNEHKTRASSKQTIRDWPYMNLAYFAKNDNWAELPLG